MSEDTVREIMNEVTAALGQVTFYHKQALEAFRRGRIKKHPYFGVWRVAESLLDKSNSEKYLAALGASNLEDLRERFLLIRQDSSRIIEISNDDFTTHEDLRKRTGSLLNEIDLHIVTAQRFVMVLFMPVTFRKMRFEVSKSVQVEPGKSGLKALSRFACFCSPENRVHLELTEVDLKKDIQRMLQLGYDRWFIGRVVMWRVACSITAIAWDGLARMMKKIDPVAMAFKRWLK